MNQTAGSLRMIIVMGGIGVISGIMIVLVYQYTLPIIKRNRAEALQTSILRVVPGATSSKIFQIDSSGTVVPFNEKDERSLRLYGAYNAAGQLKGVAVEARGQGFQDVIHILYGYDPEQQAVVGMQVLESRETPGLGDKIEKDADFVRNFEALSVVPGDDGRPEHPVTMVKNGKKTDPWQVEAITGATISSRAIANILRASTDQNLPVILNTLPHMRTEAGQ
ncbi:MAG: FMN-binding protein [Leptospiraceae bacterium]|nr:FMN-binding protein [Leptospiraceae bacterium]